MWAVQPSTGALLKGLDDKCQYIGNPDVSKHRLPLMLASPVLDETRIIQRAELCAP